MTAIRILLVDDHLIVRQGLRSLLELESDFVVIGEAASGAKALEIIETLHPDVVLLDLKMPGVDGLAVCEKALALHPELPIIMLTAISGDDSVLQCIRAGAKGYVLKEVDVVELARTIRAVHQGESVLDSKIAGAVLSEIRRKPVERKEEITLSPREAQIVQLLSQGLTNYEIGQQLYLSASTVKLHIHKVAEKLGVNSRAAVTYEASKRGLI